jgi:hypothetical protein
MAFKLTDGSTFIHLPRSGGTFATSVLKRMGVVEEPVGLKHDCPGVVQFDMRRPLYVFVRHPYDLMRSTYAYLKGERWGPWPKEKEQRWWHPWSEITKGCDEDSLESFDAWLAWVVRERTGYVTRLYSKFADWPSSVRLKTENIEEELVWLGWQLEVPESRSREVIWRAQSSRNKSPIKVPHAGWEVRVDFLASETGAVRMWEAAGHAVKRSR